MAAVVGIGANDDADTWPAALARGVKAAGTVGEVPSLRVVGTAAPSLPGAGDTGVRRLSDAWGDDDPLLVELARDVHGYLTGNSSALVDAVTAAFEPDTAVVVGHGFGALVAFDVLRRSRATSIRALVTLGAPLGLASLLRVLNVPEPLAAPHGVRWINVLDPADVRTGGEGLADLGPGITDQYVDNGERPHEVAAYLAQGTTGRAVLGAITG